MASRGTNETGIRATLASAAATSAGVKDSRQPAVHAWKAKSSRRYRSTGRSASSAAPVPASTWLAANRAAPAMRISGRLAADIATGGSAEATTITAAAAAIVRTYWAALKTTLMGAVRSRQSAITEQAASTTIAGA